MSIFRVCSRRSFASYVKSISPMTGTSAPLLASLTVGRRTEFDACFAERWVAGQAAGAKTYTRHLRIS
jgi:hypothetical protein